MPDIKHLLQVFNQQPCEDSSNRRQKKLSINKHTETRKLISLINVKMLAAPNKSNHFYSSFTEKDIG